MASLCRRIIAGGKNWGRMIHLVRHRTHPRFRYYRAFIVGFQQADQMAYSQPSAGPCLIPVSFFFLLAVSSPSFFISDILERMTPWSSYFAGRYSPPLEPVRASLSLPNWALGNMPMRLRLNSYSQCCSRLANHLGGLLWP